MPLGLPFQGLIWYFVENAYGDDGTLLTDTTGFCISSKVQNVRFSVADLHEEVRGIQSACASALRPLANDFTLHIEYHPQCSDTLLFKTIDRWGSTPSDCSFDSLAFAIGTNTCLTDNVIGNNVNGTNYFVTGAVPKTTRINAAFNTLYTVTLDFSCRTILSDGAWPAYPTDTGGMVGLRPCCCSDVGVSTYMGQLLGFNHAGSIQKDADDVAYVVDGIDITFDFDTQDKWDHDSMIKQYSFPGAVGVSGTIDLSLNEGGGVHWAEVLNQDEWDLIIDLGGPGCPRITLPTCRWKSTEVELNVSSDPLMSSVPFTCKPGARCTDGFMSSTP